MTERNSGAEEVPARLAEILTRHDERTLAAVRAYCDRLIEESETEREIDERSL